RRVLHPHGTPRHRRGALREGARQEPERALALRPRSGRLARRSVEVDGIFMSLAGTRLGAYEILARIGAGGMGEVYRARHGRLGRDVAIKVLPASVANDGDRLARFDREARLLASLNHPNIAQIYGIEESDGVTALVLELIEGETLAARLKRSRALPL